MIKKEVRGVFRKLSVLIRKILHKRIEINQQVKERYSPLLLALAGSICCLLVSAAVLFIPPFLGVANDSIGNRKMQEYGFLYREADLGDDGDEFASNEYFTRCYQTTGNRQEIFSSQDLFVHLAEKIDYFFTGDSLFDIRFLALVYLAFYVPGVFFLIHSALERVMFFSEGVALTVFGVLIFSDISYITYLNSLYADALIFICLIFISGAALSLHKEHKWNIVCLFALTGAGAILCLVEKRFFLAGFFLSVFLLAQLRIFKRSGEKVMTVLLSCVLAGCSLLSLLQCGEEFDETGKFHAMTRGVLFESEKPDETLEDMGIDVSYSILADCSLYEYYPVSEIENDLLQEGFLDQYTMIDIVLFYLRNPKALISIWDEGIKSAFNLRRDYCGNYERSTGNPAMGKSIFWSAWSIFKTRSAPKTIGYLMLLILAFSVMSGKKVFNRRIVDRWDHVYFWLMVCVALVGMADLTYVILKSGDAQLVQYNMTIGVVMDILLYYVAAEILHKLNILETKNER